jgi:hypothetical protein
MPDENRRARYREKKDIRESCTDQADQSKKDNESINSNPKRSRSQIGPWPSPRICLDCNRDRLPHEENSNGSYHEVERLAAERFSRKETDQQWTENEYPRAMILGEKDLSAKKVFPHGGDYI